MFSYFNYEINHTRAKLLKLNLPNKTKRLGSDKPVHPLPAYNSYKWPIVYEHKRPPQNNIVHRETYSHLEEEPVFMQADIDTCNIEAENIIYTEDIVSNIEAESVSNIEADIVSNNEAESVRNIEADIVINNEADIVINIEADLVSNIEAKIVSNIEAEIVSNNEVESVRNIEADIVINNEAEIVSNIEAEIVSNNETELVSNNEAVIVSNNESENIIYTEEIVSHIEAIIVSNNEADIVSRIEYFVSNIEAENIIYNEEIVSNIEADIVSNIDVIHTEAIIVSNNEADIVGSNNEVIDEVEIISNIIEDIGDKINNVAFGSNDEAEIVSNNDADVMEADNNVELEETVIIVEAEYKEYICDNINEAEVGSIDEAEVGIIVEAEVGSIDEAEVGSIDEAEVGSIDEAEVGIIDEAEVGSIDEAEVGSNASYIIEAEKEDAQLVAHIVYQYTYQGNKSATGFGDFIRSIYFMRQFTEKYNMALDITVHKHRIKRYLECFHAQPDLDAVVKTVHLFDIRNYIPVKHYNALEYVYKDVDTELLHFIRQLPTYNNHAHFYLINHPDMNKITKADKQFVKDIIAPTKEVVHHVDHFLTTLQLRKRTFITVHIRYYDEPLERINKKLIHQMHYIIQLIHRIREDTGSEILLLTSCDTIKQTVVKLAPYVKTHFNVIGHTCDKTISDNSILNTLKDFYAMSYSTHIYGFSVYDHGTGFSKWCAETYDIPYVCYPI